MPVALPRSPLVVLSLLAAMLWAAPAQAGGSIGLDEVLHAVQGAPQIALEVDAQRRRLDLKVAEVICGAARHGNQWTHLGGARAAPYTCPIGDRTLTVEADRTYYDVNGKRLGQLGQAPDKVLFGRAKSFREGNFRWGWAPNR